MTAALEAPAGLAAPQDRLVTLPEGIPELTLGWEVIHWCEKYLRHANGPRAGKPWRFTESQIRFRLWWYAVTEEGRWIYDHGVRRLAKGSGKSPDAAVWSIAELCGPVRLADFDSRLPGGCKGKRQPMALVQIAATSENQPLALDTVVPTPEGWSTVGNLKAGDSVFASDGNPVIIQETTPVFTGQDCYRLEFDDGESIVASASHAWTLMRSSKHDRKYEEITVSTQQIADDPPVKGGMRRYKVRYQAINMPEAHLPLDPYLLGRWLGDGDSADSSIACGEEDKAETEVILKDLMQPWEVLVWTQGTGRWGKFRIRRHPRICRWGHDWSEDERVNGAGHVQCGRCISRREYSGEPLLTMREKLRQAGVLGNKHIPEIYKRASYSQRLSLLQGLIDSDGHITTKGRAQFTNTKLRLISDVEEILATLGLKSWTDSHDEYKKTVFFTPLRYIPAARLTRKVINQRRHMRPRDTFAWKYLQSITKVPSVPVKCISIDTDDNLFIVGRRGTLTHNTANTMRQVRAMTSKGSRIVQEYGLDPGKTVIYSPDGGQLEIITSSAAAAEGAETTAAVSDETEHWKPSNGGLELAAVIDRNLGKSGSRGIETCNSWEPGAESVAEATWDAWVAQEEGRTVSEARILYDARIAPPEAAANLKDVNLLTQAVEFVYGDCYWQDTRTVVGKILSLRTTPEDSKRFYLNRPTAGATAWAKPEEVSLLVDSRKDIVSEGDDIALFFDGSRTRDASALVACHIETGHVFTVDIWEPRLATATQPAVIVHPEMVDDAVSFAFRTWNPVAFFSDVKEFETFARVEWPRRYQDRLKIWAVPGGKEPQPVAWDMRDHGHVHDFTKACELTLSEIEDRLFTYDGDSRLGRHIVNAHRAPNRWGVSISKESRSSSKKIDGCVAMIGARMARRLYLAWLAEQNGKASRHKAGRVWGFE